MSAVPITIAIAAGGLTVLNPCGFPLLPAFLSFYLAADEGDLPQARSRAFQGLAVGALVTVGMLAFFSLVAIPVVAGVGSLSHALPWLGLATGGTLVVVGGAGLAGRSLSPRLPRPARASGRTGWPAMLAFGVAYGAASLGCTLPLLLTFVATALGGSKVEAFVAYGFGMALVLCALSVCVALLRASIVRGFRRSLAFTARIGNLLLIASGAYLTYYWARLRFGDTATVADDPIVGFAVTSSSQVRIFARAHSYPTLTVAATIVLVAGAVALRSRRGTATIEQG